MNDCSRIRECDRRSKAAGTLIGRYLQQVTLAGCAVYEIIEEHLETVRIRVCRGLPGTCVFPYWGHETLVYKSYALRNIAAREAADACL